MMGKHGWKAYGGGEDKCGGSSYRLTKAEKRRMSDFLYEHELRLYKKQYRIYDRDEQ